LSLELNEAVAEAVTAGLRVKLDVRDQGFVPGPRIPGVCVRIERVEVLGEHPDHHAIGREAFPFMRVTPKSSSSWKTPEDAKKENEP
jgi:hypothetical protein